MRNLPGYWRGFLFIYWRPSQYFCSIPFPTDLSQATTLHDKCQCWSCLTTIIENYEVEVWPQRRKGIVTAPNPSTVSDCETSSPSHWPAWSCMWVGVDAACYRALPEFWFLLSLIHQSYKVSKDCKILQRLYPVSPTTLFYTSARFYICDPNSPLGHVLSEVKVS